MSNWFKRNSIHFIIAAVFFVICFLYFTPAFQGKTLGQSDVVGAQSTQKEINDYRAKDTTILWTNQIFGGMPAFQIWAPYPDNLTTHIVSALKAIFPNPIDTVLILLFGSYFLFLVLKLTPWLAAAGAVAFTFSSYNIILLVAGHSNQAFAIAFFCSIVRRNNFNAAREALAWRRAYCIVPGHGSPRQSRANDLLFIAFARNTCMYRVLSCYKK